MGLLAGALTGCADLPTPSMRGVVWQPDAATIRPSGDWERLGARELLVQWTVVDGVALTPIPGLPDAPVQPDWPRIGVEPWASRVIVGLAGMTDESRARGALEELARQSAMAARNPPPVRVAGWYFPVEIDPGWTDATRLRLLLASLPRPLWVSAYDGQNVGPGPLATLLKAALPEDVGVLLQDGVGGHARSPEVAVHYVQVLRRALGRRRVRLIAEAFRPAVGGGLRAATASELASQLRAYRGVPVYVFDGPHYVSANMVDSLAARTALSRP